MTRWRALAESLVGLALVSLLAPSLGRAQTIVKGTVTDEKKAPIVGAEILIDDVVQTRTAAGGIWEVELANAGVYTITARTIGYHPAVRRMLVAQDDEVTVHLVLERAAQTLDSLTVVAPEARVSAKMQAFEERRRAGFGRFLTREMLAEREHSTLENTLRMVTGVRLIRRPSDCGGGVAAASGRGGVNRWLPWMSCTNGTPFPMACYLAVFLDGIRVWAPGTKEPVDVNQYSINSLEGVEIYRGAAETPTQYQTSGYLMNGNPCGVLLLWTRTGES